ncbi:hypothetical protein HOLleu_31468 [Holothuria leucospilota]|uniref:GIY-YIG domain-containing protein n=1 Tax=Holothuria leucospilota TaxID=206669 RepID=A0A9Q0YQG9_HOLLE|nr:hypothetical protein HOLleu_31468 [Holothuria leucospilota]
MQWSPMLSSKHIVTESVVTVPGTDINLHPGPFNCNSANVIYLIFCSICPHGNYVGETKTPFRLRLNNHKQTIRKNFQLQAVSQHFNLPGHDIDNVRVCLIKGGFRSVSEGKASELRLIKKLDTLNNGLNRELSHLGAFTCLR